MKKLYIFILSFCFSAAVLAQAPFWTETFGSGCNTNQLADGFVSTNGTWSVAVIGPQGSFSNLFYVSAEEGGMPAATCGTDCPGSGNNRTLHISTDPNILGDVGAAYLAGSFGLTDKRAQSPIINCTGQSNISMTFTYILQGVPGSDYFTVDYYNGSTWTNVATPPPTINGGCSGQGLWTTYSLMLPSSANNNPNVRIGVRWYNSNASGADPGIAIDNINLASTTSSFSPTFTAPASACVGSSINVTAITGTYVVSGYTWTSIPPGLVFGSPNASATSVTFPMVGPYSISLTAVSGGTTGSYNQMVNVVGAPNITATASPSAICSGTAAVLSASGGTAYTWNPGAMSGSTVGVSPTVTTVYTVAGTASTGCTGTKTVQVIVNTGAINATASSNTICSGSSATLSVANGSNVTWNPGGLNGASVVVTPTANTTYTATGTGTNGCGASAAVTVSVVICNGLNSVALNNSSYMAFPNPASDKLIIQSSHSANHNCEIELRDALGKLLSRNNHTFNSNSNQYRIDLNGMSPGVYFVRISSSEDSRVIRFVKE